LIKLLNNIESTSQAVWISFLIISFLVPQDEKDRRIRELSLELYNERQKCKRRCAAYEEQLNLILNDLEKHTEHISEKVAAVVRSIREIEEEKSDSDSG